MRGQILLYSHLLGRHGQVSLDLGLVDAVDADPHEVAADDRAPQGVSCSQVEIKAEIKDVMSIGTDGIYRADIR